MIARGQELEAEAMSDVLIAPFMSPQPTGIVG